VNKSFLHPALYAANLIGYARLLLVLVMWAIGATINITAAPAAAHGLAAAPPIGQRVSSTRFPDVVLALYVANAVLDGVDGAVARALGQVRWLAGWLAGWRGPSRARPCLER
jgi:phosphatidylglycerophosphate synthase